MVSIWMIFLYFKKKLLQNRYNLFHNIIDFYYKCNSSSKTIALQKSFDPLMFNQVLLQIMIDVCIFKTLCALDDGTEGHTSLWLNLITRLKDTLKAIIHFIFDHHVVKDTACKPNLRNCIKIPLSWRILDDCLNILCVEIHQNIPPHLSLLLLEAYWNNAQCDLFILEFVYWLDKTLKLG